MSEPTADQRRIAAWFDATYTRLGTRYLRRREAYLVFPTLVDLGSDDTLLDVACGPGMLLLAARERSVRLHGCDISAVALAQARERVPEARLALANAQALPYPRESFDVVTCLGSLERMLDRRAALAEMLRVGRPGARYCFLVRNANTRRWRLFGGGSARIPARGHPDADTVENWWALFESVGLRVRDVLPDQYPLLRRQHLRRLFRGGADFRRAVVSSAPLSSANEFVFVLERAP